jgi:flavin reductase (DIM6/NTAB) family NADH-FMN oxidoreductase RutF
MTEADMLISLGPQAFLSSVPVMLVGTYDAEGRPNIMAAALGGLSCSQPPCLSISVKRSSWTYRALLERRAFTVSLPTSTQAGVADFAWLVSGRFEDKFAALGLTAVAGEHVDAPYVAECPVVLELLLRHTLDLGSHTQFVGEIMDVKVDKASLGPDGLPDPAKLSALHYAPLTNEYYASGDFVARAFAVGKTVRRQG